jgi:transposase
LDQKLQPRLEEAKCGKRTVYFADAAHFVHGAFIARVWCIVRIFIPTPSGRSRYNVFGVIDAITHNFISVCNTTYINHLSVIELLEKIREMHKDSVIPISVFMDNAKYQVCKAVTERAAALNIELMFLPSYSPNLNLIERLWKWVKKDCLNCKYYINSCYALPPFLILSICFQAAFKAARYNLALMAK